MKQVKLGEYNQLVVVKEALRPNPHAFGGKEKFGVYLDGGVDGDILMPLKYVPQGIRVGDTVRCFVYLDQDERPIATTETPLAQVGEFACLRCSWVNDYGAFLDWGLMKDLFCPFREQKKNMEIGSKYIVHVHLDDESYRIVASAKVERYMSDQRPAYRHGDRVQLLAWQKSDLGFKFIVDNAYQGLAYQNQIFREVHTGDRMEGFVDQVRPDGKIDLTLQPTGQQGITAFSEQLLAYLRSHEGYCDLGDKSDAEDIKRRFQVSKKVYKRAVGELYKLRLITIEDNGIKLK